MKKLATVFIVFLVLMGGLPVQVWGQPSDFAEEEAAYRQALQYIQQHRKNNVTLTILDQTGHPVSNANVSYQQTSHDFVFGIFGSPWAIPEDSDAKGWALYSNLCSANPEVELDWEMWATIEPAKGTFHWNKADWWFQRITDHCPSARFVLMFDDLACCGVKVASWTGISNLSNASAFGKFKQYLHDYVYQVVKRYSDRVDWWITENELNASPASDTLGSMGKEIDVDHTVVQAIKDANSDSRIILMAGLYPHYASNGQLEFADPIDFARQALASGIQVNDVSVEAYPTHFGGQIRTPLFYQQYTRNMASVLHKPVFVQETGYPSQPCAACGTADWATAWNGIFDEPTQAAWVRYMTTDMFGTDGVIGVVNFPYHTPTATSLFRDFGLFTTGGYAKQAYYVLLNQTQMFTTSGNSSTNTDGVVMFRGSAGNYTISLPGYESTTIHVSEQGNNTFTLTISSLALRNEASQTLEKAYANLTAAPASFQSPEAKSLLAQSFDEYNIAQQDFNLKAYEATILHAQEALNLLHQAYSKEYQQVAASTQKYAATTIESVGVEEAFVGAAVLVGLSLFAIMLWRRRRSPVRGRPN